jgi:hypothetical protein
MIPLVATGTDSVNRHEPRPKLDEQNTAMQPFQLWMVILDLLSGQWIQTDPLPDLENPQAELAFTFKDSRKDVRYQT